VFCDSAGAALAREPASATAMSSLAVVAHSAPVLFAAQVCSAVVAVQAVHRGLVSAAPLYAAVADRVGPHAAACLANLAVASTAHLVGVLLTIPALVGVKVWKIQVSRVASVAQLMRSVPLIALNYVLSVVVSSAATLCGSKPGVLADIASELPSGAVLAGQTALFLCLTEVWFYHVHRAFHVNKRLYALVHKVHHTWQAPVAIVGTYAHPVEHVGCNMASILVGPLLCGAHPVTAWAYTLVFAIGAYGHHCGYWTDDLGMHDLHHEAFNVNYGNAHILDYLYGTYRVRGAAGPGCAAGASKASACKAR